MKLLKRILSLFLIASVLLCAAPEASLIRSGKAEADSIDDKLTAYAAECFPNIHLEPILNGKEAVTFRKFVYSVYGGDPNTDDSNAFLKLIVDFYLDYENNEEHQLDQDIQFNNVMRNIALLQVVLESAQESFEETCENALSESTSKSLSGLALSALIDHNYGDMIDLSGYGFSCYSLYKKGMAPLKGKSENTLDRVTAIIKALTAREEHFQYVVSSVGLLEDIALYAPNEDLRLAAEAMAACYRSWSEHLKSLDFTTIPKEKLLDGSGYTEVMNDWVDKSLREYVEKKYRRELNATFIEVSRKLLRVSVDFFMGSPGVSLALVFKDYAPDLLINSTQIADLFASIICFNNIAETLRLITVNSLPAHKSWKDYISYAQLYSMYIRVCAMGNTYMYNLVNLNSLLSLFRKKNLDVEEWYKLQKNVLHDTGVGIQVFISQVMSRYLSLVADSDDMWEMLAREDLHRRTVSGKLTHDAFFADEEDRPDTDHPDEDQGRPAEGVSVRLVSADDGREIDSTFSDATGWYELSYVQEAVLGEQLELVIGETCRKETFARRRVAVWNNPSFDFRSSWKSGMAGEYAEGGDTLLDGWFEYCDQLFLQPPNQYSQELARLSLGLAAAGFSAPQSDRYWNRNADVGREQNLALAYSRLGFSNARYINYDKELTDSSGKVAFSVASRDIIDPFLPVTENEEQEVHLVVAVIRGGGYGAEWSNNFHVTGPDGSIRYHYGFYQAATEVVREIRSYISEEFGDGLPVKLWMTGFSRGGAVANLTAELLQSGAIDSYYVYTFAAPAGTQQATALPGVFNIVYGEDIVPRLAPEAWGFGRNGATMVFSMPASKLDEEQAARIDGEFRRLVKFSGAGYDPYDYTASSLLLDGSMNYLARVAPSAKAYADSLQKFIVPITKMVFSRRYDEKTGKDTTDLHYLNLLMAEAISAGHPIYGKIMDVLLPALEAGKTPDEIREQLQDSSWYASSRKDPESASLVNAVISLLGKIQGTAVNLIDAIMEGPEFVIAFINVAIAAHDMGLTYSEVLKIGGNDDETTGLLTVTGALLEFAGVLELYNSTNTGLSGIAMGHMPEVYLSWLMGLTAEEMFGIDDRMSFDMPVMKKNVALVKGKVYDGETGDPMKDARVILRAWDGTAVELFTDEKGYWEYACRNMAFNIEVFREGYQTKTIETVLHTDGEDMFETYLKRLSEGKSTVLFCTVENELDGHAWRYDMRPRLEGPEYGAAIDAINRDLTRSYENLADLTAGSRELRSDWRIEQHGSALLAEYSTSSVAPNGRLVEMERIHFQNLETGGSFHLDDLFTDAEAKGRFERLLAQSITDAHIDQLYMTPEAAARQFVNGSLGSWTFRGDKLEVLFSRGDLARNFIGSYTYSLDSDLSGIVKPIFSSNAFVTEGVLTAVLSNDPAVSGRKELGYRTFGKGGALSLIVDGSITDLCVRFTLKGKGSPMVVGSCYCRDSVITFDPPREGTLRISYYSNGASCTGEMTWDGTTPVLQIYSNKQVIHGNWVYLRRLAGDWMTEGRAESLEKAIRALIILCENDPGNAYDCLNLGRIFSYTGDWQKMLKYSLDALELAPGHPDALLMMTNAHIRLHMNDEAIGDAAKLRDAGFGTNELWDLEVLLITDLVRTMRLDEAEALLGTFDQTALREDQAAVFRMLTEQIETRKAGVRQ